MRRSAKIAGIIAAVCGVSMAAESVDTKDRAAQGQSTHPAVGTWVGKAVQVCGEPVSACAKGAIMMTPTVNADGNFIANDTLELIPPPFGTHTTAHGFWEATGPKSMIADYVFICPTLSQVTFPTTTLTRLRWSSETIEDDNTMVGYVNVYNAPLVPTVWESLGPNQWPTVPKEGYDTVKVPQQTIYKDPKECTLYPASACPLVFKFKILRLLTQ